MRLTSVRISIHHRCERCVDESLDVAHRTEALTEFDALGARRAQLTAHAPVDINISTPEAIDRLFRIADDEQLAALGHDVLPPRFVGIRGGQQQQQLRLQRIGVLEFVHEDASKAFLEVAPDVPIVPYKIARAHQQIEKIERALPLLQRLVSVDARQQLALEKRRQLGIRSNLEFSKREGERISRLEHLRARDALSVRRPAPLPTPLEIPIAVKLDKTPLQAIEVVRSNTLEIAAGTANRRGVDIEVVAGVRGPGRHLGEPMHQLGDGDNRRSAIKWPARPQTTEVAPLRE